MSESNEDHLMDKQQPEFMAIERDGHELSPAEIDRFAAAIARVASRGDEPGSEGLRRAGNTYATAFQFLVLRRGSPYAAVLGAAAAEEALRRLEHDAAAKQLVQETIAEIHERVCRETEPMPGLN